MAGVSACLRTRPPAHDPAMAAGSLLTLLDDIASILDDVSILTKKAAAKTAGVLGDDLALNAQQVSGVVSKRELPVVWAVAKGSFINKLILVPLALLISAFAPWAIVPLLMIGGLYLCFEGCEKLAHHFLHREKKSISEASEEIAALAATPPEATVETEADKIKGAVRTDFVLSAEIIAITLGTVAMADFTRQVLVLSSISIVMTVGVYGLVAGIVKLDDAGLYLTQCRGGFQQRFGRAILWAAPFLMKTLSIAGTAAMFLVGGGILTHGIPALHHSIEHLGESLSHSGGMGAVLAPLIPTLLNGLCGLVAGTLALLLFNLVQKLRGKTPAAHPH
jgi:predicted DNA repair protein MutK